MLTDTPKLTAWLGKSLDATKIKEGDDVYFECTYLANPMPYRVSWYKDVSIHPLIKRFWEGTSTLEIS